MKRIILLSALMGIGVVTSGSTEPFVPQADKSIQEFWQKFSTAVIKADKAAVAGHTRFPVSMPYGMAAVRNKAQLTKRYQTVFNGEANAVKCFATAKPETDPAHPKSFSVACPNAANDPVVIYSFTRTTTGWKFTGLDNLNE